MQQAIDQHFRTMKNRGAAVRALVTSIPSRDHVLLRPTRLTPADPKRKYIDFPMGGIWRRNHQHAAETDGKSGDLFFDCLYDLRDSGRHTIVGYGMRNGSLHGEVTRIRIDAQTARMYAEYLRRTRAYAPEDAKSIELLYADLIASYQAKRDEHKLTALERWLRGAVVTDSLGKHNPMAAALVTYAGIRHLVKRTETIPRIATAVDGKTLLVDAYIQEHVALFRELWDALKMSSHRADRGRFQILIDAADQNPRNHDRDRQKARHALEALLEDFHSALGRIVARPFSRNASHTRKDLGEAIRLARVNDLTGVRRQIAKIRQGIRWVFVLDHLRERVLTPLSFLIDRLHAKESSHRRAERRRTILSGEAAPMAKRQPIVVTRAMAPESFDRIENELQDFLVKLGKCSDADLETKVKAPVEAIARDALRAMQEDRWLLAKKRLRVAAKKL